MLISHLLHLLKFFVINPYINNIFTLNYFDFESNLLTNSPRNFEVATVGESFLILSFAEVTLRKLSTF